MSWSANAEVARAFALGVRDRYTDGSVLIETLAPPHGIVCAPALLVSIDGYCEEEYILDRRQLTHVRVLERFAPENLPIVDDGGNP